MNPTAKNLINFFENLKAKTKLNTQTQSANVKPKLKPGKNQMPSRSKNWKKCTPAKLKSTNVVDSPRNFVKHQPKPWQTPTIKLGPESKLKNCPPEKAKTNAITSPTNTAKFPAKKPRTGSAAKAKGIKKITSYFETKERRKPEENLDPTKK